MAPVEVTAATLTDEGFRFDRCFILVYAPSHDGSGSNVPGVHPPTVNYLTIKRVFRLALFRLEIDAAWATLTVRFPSATPTSTSHPLVLPLTPSPLSLLGRPKYRLNIGGTPATGIDMGDEAASFFTIHLSTDVRLVYIGGSGNRELPWAPYMSDLNWTINSNIQKQRIRFADFAHLLITSTASEEEARSRLPPAHRSEDVILRFRPNIHIDVHNSVPAFDEDDWVSLVVHPQNQYVEKSPNVTLKCMFSCVRCLSLNADPGTGGMAARERQLYGLLAKDRRVNPQSPSRLSCEPY